MLNKQKLLYDLFQAYYDARKNKRNTLNQLDFEFNLEENLIKLYNELLNWTYRVWRSIYFIQNHPVKREIFAWDFRDRIIHHLVYNCISPIFEKEFIYDSYSCRKWKWTSLGIKRVSKFIRSCSENYTKDCYVLKLDISGYFMSINKDILFEKIERVLRNYCHHCHYLVWLDNLEKSIDEGNRSPGQARGWQKWEVRGWQRTQAREWKRLFDFFYDLETIPGSSPRTKGSPWWQSMNNWWQSFSCHYLAWPDNLEKSIDESSRSPGQARGWQRTKARGWQILDYNFLINLIKKIIYNDCTKNSVFRWKRVDYIGLPKNKSLFFAKDWCGLPIWNLTSQLFSNIYLSDFDKYIKKDLVCKYYWRYVDDFIIIHENKEFLISVIERTKKYLNDNLWLRLHPNKIYLQHYSKWVLFLGTYIKPYRVYIRKRTIWYFYKKIQKLNTKLKNNDFKLDDKIKQDFLSVINSYLGILKYYKAYKITKKLLINHISSNFIDYFSISKWYTKIIRKN